ncbi:MAG: CpaE family protein, partial [Candidatus Dormibacteria bacterium]
MSEVRFADGFDGPDPIVFGLGPAQLLSVVTGLLLTYAFLQAPLPIYVRTPGGLVIVAVSASLGWLRLEGRPLIDWLARAMSFLLRRRSGPLAPSATGAPRHSGPPVSTMVASPLTMTLRPPAWPAPDPRVVPAVRGAMDRYRRPTEEATPLRGTAGRSVAFFSLNGGSGRTMLAIEAACLLAARGRGTASGGASAEPLRVVLMDLDALAATLAARLGIAQPTTWAYATAGADDGANATTRLVEHASGVRVLPGPPKPLTAPAQVMERHRLENLRTALRTQGQHITIMDIGGDLGPMAGWGLETADQIYVVMTPTPGGIQDAYRSTELLRRMGHRHKLAYVANRCAGADRLTEVMADLQGRLVAVVPRDPGFEEAEKRHQALGPGARGGVRTALALLAADV